MSTYLVKVFENDEPPPAAWHPWVNVKPADVPMLGAMAAHKHMRTRGGIGEHEPSPLRVHVYIAPPDVDRGPDGEPVACLGETFNVTRGARA